MARKRRKKTMDQIKVQMHGAEPTFEYEGVKENDIPWENLRAYNWYAQEITSKKKRPWIMAYARHIKLPKNDIAAINQADVKEIFTPFAIYARMAVRGAKLHGDREERLREHIRECVRLGKRNKKKKESDETNKKSVQDYLKEKIDSHIEELNIVVDLILENIDKPPSFSLYDWLKRGEIPGMHATKLVTMYLQPQFVEIAQAIKGTDEQLVEAYAFLTDKQKRLFAAHLHKMIADANAYAEANKKTRKPRKRRPVSASKAVAKMTFKQRDDSYKIASIAPEKIVGAMILYTFNTKNRALTVFTATGPDGLGVKGTTILRFDPKQSYSKTVRKPETMLPKFSTSGKRAIAKMLTSIRAKEKAVTGRINKHTILVKVL